jgi:hypothetical protein
MDSIHPSTETDSDTVFGRNPDTPPTHPDPAEAATQPTVALSDPEKRTVRIFVALPDLSPTLDVEGPG